MGSQALASYTYTNGRNNYLQKLAYGNGDSVQYTYDSQGRVLASLTENGSIWNYTYDAWGNILTTGGSLASTLGTINPLRYRGYVYDVESGLYYLQSRYYDPEMGRFINGDSYAATGQGFVGNNMFVYCGNNPASNVDPSGTAYKSVLDNDLVSINKKRISIIPKKMQ